MPVRYGRGSRGRTSTLVVAYGVRQVNPDVLAAGVFGIAGSIVGALFGVIVATLMRSGRLRCEASLKSLSLTGVEKEPGYPRQVPLEHADETTNATGVSYVCEIDLFNGGEVPTGLRDIAVVFVCASGERFVCQTYDRRGEPVVFLNLMPRQFKCVELRGDFGREAADALKTGRWRRIEFEAQRPRRPLLWRKAYRKTITRP